MNTVKETVNTERKWTIRRFNNAEEAAKGIVPDTIIDGKGRVLPGLSEIDGNVLLNEGINNVLLALLCGTAAATAFDNANANLGVGNDDTVVAEDPTQTGLQGATTTFAGMTAGYPSVASQVATWQAEFGGAVGNHDWKEFTVVNAAADTGDNLNRKVSDQGTKASGQTWLLTLEITFS